MTRLLLFHVGLLLLIVIGAIAIAQVGRSPYPGQPGRGVGLPQAVPDTGSKKQKSPDEPLPSFPGIVRGIDAKGLTIERPDSNTMDFHCSKKTKYFDGSKKIKPSDVKPGDSVSVEAKRAIDGSLDAVSVRLDRRKSS
jgi:hypothetical protein